MDTPHRRLFQDVSCFLMAALLLSKVNHHLTQKISEISRNYLNGSIYLTQSLRNVYTSVSEIIMEINDLRELALDPDRPKQNRWRFEFLTACR